MRNFRIQAALCHPREACFLYTRCDVPREKVAMGILTKRSVLTLLLYCSGANIQQNCFCFFHTERKRNKVGRQESQMPIINDGKFIVDSIS